VSLSQCGTRGDLDRCGRRILMAAERDGPLRLLSRGRQRQRTEAGKPPHSRATRLRLAGAHST